MNISNAQLKRAHLRTFVTTKRINESTQSEHDRTVLMFFSKRKRTLF